MDQDVINLAKAIREKESNNNFNAVGDNGTSGGAYQWQKGTWKEHSNIVFGKVVEMTPANQNTVAYGVMKTWKDQGLNPAQIAAKWNSGSEVGWENKIGYNAKIGVNYNVPAYVKDVTERYQRIKNQSATSSDGAQLQQQETEKPGYFGRIGNTVSDTVSKVGETFRDQNLAGIEKITRSAGNIAGGVSSIIGDTLVSGATSAVRSAAGLVLPQSTVNELGQDFNRGLEVIGGKIAQVPLVQDFARGMQVLEERGTNPEAPLANTLYESLLKPAVQIGTAVLDVKGIQEIAKPFLSKVVKPTVGKVASKVLKASNLEEFASKGYAKDLQEIVTNNAPLRNLQGKNLKTNKFNFVDDISRDSEIARSIVPKDNKFNTDAAREIIQSRMDKLDSLTDDFVPMVDAQNLAAKPSTSQLVADLKDNLQQSVSKGVLTQSEADDALQFGVKTIQRQFSSTPESVPFVEVDKLRKAASSRVRDFYGDAVAQKQWKELYNSLRTSLYRGLDNIGGISKQEINKAWEYLIAYDQFLEKFSRVTPKGGRLGGYLGRVVGAVSGGASGNVFGAIAGAEIGAKIASIVRDTKLGNSIKAKLIKNLVKDPAIIKKLEEVIPFMRKGYVPSNIKALPAPKTEVKTQFGSGKTINLPKNALKEDSPSIRIFSKEHPNGIIIDRSFTSEWEDAQKSIIDSNTKNIQQLEKITEELNTADRIDSIKISLEESLQYREILKEQLDSMAPEKALYNSRIRTKEGTFQDNQIARKNDKSLTKSQRVASSNRNKMLEAYSETHTNVHWDGNADLANELADNYKKIRDQYINNEMNIKRLKKLLTQKNNSNIYVSEENYKKAVENFNRKMSDKKLKLSLLLGGEKIIKTAPEIVTIAAYHIGNGVKTAIELGDRLAKAGYKFTKNRP